MYRESSVDSYSIQRPSFNIEPKVGQKYGDFVLKAVSTWLGTTVTCQFPVYTSLVDKNTTSMYYTYVAESILYEYEEVQARNIWLDSYYVGPSLSYSFGLTGKKNDGDTPSL